MAEERLHKVIARHSAASRREAERWISAGRVTVNGRRVAELGTKVDEERDRVAVDGRDLHPIPRDYWAAHKPAWVDCTGSWPGPAGSRPALADAPSRLYPVGRMDAATSGLILYTNDGALAFALTRPDREVDEEYLVRATGRLLTEDVRRLRRGLERDGLWVRPELVTVGPYAQAERATPLDLRVRDRDTRARLRWLFDGIGHPIVALCRIRIGPVRLGELAPGEARRLTVDERTALRSMAGLR